MIFPLSRLLYACKSFVYYSYETWDEIDFSISLQLRGRSGRQGDPGSSRFFLSLEDNIFRIFGGDRIQVIIYI